MLLQKFTISIKEILARVKINFKKVEICLHLFTLFCNFVMELKKECFLI
jgi:hypothetical protein